ncbi:uncharacterized protein G2W53_011905 [Senna tora]|uniref:Uncharacterized protein n=1 Tax=Senna tora TaxID=362788 RepID=A0A834TYE1_9FABA|nr:uncharacterized protein G2W53_011905 [Senna tora]
MTINAKDPKKVEDPRDLKTLTKREDWSQEKKDENQAQQRKDPPNEIHGKRTKKDPQDYQMA